MDPERRKQIEQWVAERYLASNEDRAAYHNDALSHFQFKRLLQTTTATDEALCLEGIEVETRNRVLYRLLYGDEAGARFVPPDFAGAAARMRDRLDAMMYAVTNINWATGEVGTFRMKP